MAISVVIVDDHQMLVDALAEHLASEPGIEVIGRYHSLRASLGPLKADPPDVVLLDHRLSDSTSGASTRAILDSVPKTGVLLMSASEASSVLAEALDAGVAGFVHKTRAVDAVVHAVRQVAAGETAFEPEELRGAWQRMRERRQHGELTERELEVLALLVEGNTAQAIAERLVISQHTVRNHIRHVLEKLGARTQLEAVAAALRLGLIAPPQSSRPADRDDPATD